MAVSVRVREHPVTWRVPTRILYGERDELTDMRTITEFAEKSGAAPDRYAGRRALVPHG